MFFKRRYWWDNIWKLIVFSITIVIAVWLVWILWWYYSKKLEEKKILSSLWSISTDLKTLKSVWLCKTSTWTKIIYTPIDNYYTLICSNNIWVDLSTYPTIMVLSWCKINDKTCKYKLLSY